MGVGGGEFNVDWFYVSNVMVQMVSLFSFSMVMATQKVLSLCHLLQDHKVGN